MLARPSPCPFLHHPPRIRRPARLLWPLRFARTVDCRCSFSYRLLLDIPYLCRSGWSVYATSHPERKRQPGPPKSYEGSELRQFRMSAYGATLSFLVLGICRRSYTTMEGMHVVDCRDGHWDCQEIVQFDRERQAAEILEPNPCTIASSQLGTSYRHDTLTQRRRIF